MVEDILIELIEQNTIRSKNNENEIKKLNDADNTILELIKSILEKISEVVDILHERKDSDVGTDLGKFTKQINEKGGGKGE